MRKNTSYFQQPIFMQRKFSVYAVFYHCLIKFIRRKIVRFFFGERQQFELNLKLDVPIDPLLVWVFSYPTS